MNSKCCREGLLHRDCRVHAGQTRTSSGELAYNTNFSSNLWAYSDIKLAGIAGFSGVLLEIAWNAWVVNVERVIGLGVVSGDTSHD
jgi:hypothetical protein